MIASLLQNKHARWALYVLVSTFSLSLFLKNAWAAEDAFIILRSVEQFLAGHGFRWNPHERVQVFTSPLWYLLIIASTVFCKTLYLNLIGLSLALHTLLLWASAMLLKNIQQWIVFVLLLTFSQAFFDFTASGLEYPLIYFLLSVFVLLYLRDQHSQDKYALALSAGLLLITRHDTLLLIAPILAHLAWQFHRQLPLRQKIIALMLLAAPLTLWTLFSLLYYGMPLPNTAYGKLNIDGVTYADRLTRGWIYLSKSLQLDPITPMLIFLTAVRGFCMRDTVQRTLSTGLVLATAYIFWAGGDYMLGRFYAPLYLVAAAQFVQQPWQTQKLVLPMRIAMGLCLAYLVYYLLLLSLQPLDTLFKALQWQAPSPTVFYLAIVVLGFLLFALSLATKNITQKISRAILVSVLLLSTQQFDSPWQTNYKNWGKNSDFDMWWNLNNVSRERYFIYHWTSLYAWLHRDIQKPFPDHPWCHEGASQPPVAIIALDGIIGYCMGINKIAVDIKALTDPLLARMPKNPGGVWSSGGVNRVMPEGYLESVASGENKITDADLARYYDKLKLITASEPLFSRERLFSIVAFHFGSYDHWLDAYLNRLPQTHMNRTPQ